MATVAGVGVVADEAVGPGTPTTGGREAATVTGGAATGGMAATGTGVEAGCADAGGGVPGVEASKTRGHTPHKERHKPHSISR